ncbi:myosin light chain kinase, smooth muscle [Elysia marginata]|uniref:Myosin light chain kinase, smooth muscle n=1 Tax=Elysia marginata TaxID=1093978 RepID=A0AAV4HV53_9GAST|nr:myosin light chain kinase, smooth muscle [Elysia marginata]
MYMIIYPNFIGPICSSCTSSFKPHFTSELSDVSLKDGDELVLECDIQGNPRPQISWIRDGVEIFDSQDFQISMIGDHCKLQIADIYPEDEGRYSCKAVNALGETTTSCFVTVEALQANHYIRAVFLFLVCVFLVFLKNSVAICHLTRSPANRLEATVSFAQSVPVRMRQT